MASTRAYRRDARGKFAGAGAGTRTTYGRAGGFANAAFRARTSSTNQKAGMRRSFGMGQAARHLGRTAGMLGVAGAASAVASGSGGKYTRALATTAALGAIAGAVGTAKGGGSRVTRSNSATAARGTRQHR